MNAIIVWSDAMRILFIAAVKGNIELLHLPDPIMPLITHRLPTRDWGLNYSAKPVNKHGVSAQVLLVETRRLAVALVSSASA
jgi:hypothetical protein